MQLNVFLQGRVLDSELRSVNIAEKLFASEATSFVCDKTCFELDFKSCCHLV